MVFFHWHISTSFKRTRSFFCSCFGEIIFYDLLIEPIFQFLVIWHFYWWCFRLDTHSFLQWFWLNVSSGTQASPEINPSWDLLSATSVKVFIFYRIARRWWDLMRKERSVAKRKKWKKAHSLREERTLAHPKFANRLNSNLIIRCCSLAPTIKVDQVFAVSFDWKHDMIREGTHKNSFF